ARLRWRADRQCPRLDGDSPAQSGDQSDVVSRFPACVGWRGHGALLQAARLGSESMIWVIFVAGAVFSWGVYGALLHMGQRQLGNPLKAMLCVGAAYFLIGVILPVASLSAQGKLSGFNSNGLMSATIAGALGAAGAACIIYAFRYGGLPIFTVPLGFFGRRIDYRIAAGWIS